MQGKSLEFGLKEASRKRCEEIKEEYPNLNNFFYTLKDKSAFLKKQELQQIWENSAANVVGNFEEFVSFLDEIGIIEFREKEKRYKFMDIYAHGFEMIRLGMM